jgi:hypothetical protein
MRNLKKLRILFSIKFYNHTLCYASFVIFEIYGAIKIIECPRDAQGIKPFIPTEKKVAYLQSLLRVGLIRIDFGSFVSPKAIPQMQDTAAVLITIRFVANKKLPHY